ncbi:hypothetical protein QTH89_24620 [Variovorax sp. J22G21]|uniref:hypothetical protein n=1 Tax=Variovorax fucosicus TaxID=3053517 RepID=UPI002577CE69|nr:MULTISPECIES: hypothetical protein [unclassified Variovorax]MDM0039648.1 hypothetical protein [Variovorax sp. J22R193]MDM0064423.1 hypothetical protein [Variovorax sp. J22G21]
MFKPHHELVDLPPGSTLNLVEQRNTLQDGLDGVLSIYSAVAADGNFICRYEIHDQVCMFHPPARLSQRVHKVANADQN